MYAVNVAVIRESKTVAVRVELYPWQTALTRRRGEARLASLVQPVGIAKILLLLLLLLSSLLFVVASNNACEQKASNVRIARIHNH